MTLRFLTFQGHWENEGNFFALETPDGIFVLAAGKEFKENSSENVNFDYLRENKNKIKGIFVNNTSPKNVGLLEDFYQDLNLNIPIYGSLYSKLILNYLFPKFSQLTKNFVIVKFSQELKIADFSFFFFPLNSYLLGNLAIVIHYNNYAFYYLSEFVSNSLTDNELLFSSFFTPLTEKKKHTYLITNCQNLCWNNSNNSLFQEVNFFISQKKVFIFLFYEFDWLHILELLEISKKQQKKLKILNEDFFLLLQKILQKKSLADWLAKKEDKEVNYLLVCNPENMEEKLVFYWEKILREKLDNPFFVVGTPSVIGGEEKLAKIIDYLYKQNGEVLNLSKSKHVSLGTSVDDLKLLWKMINPQAIISLQNSYKQTNYLSYFPGKFLRLANHHYLTFPGEKNYSLKTHESSNTIEKMLITQRKNLLKNGLLIILLFVKWDEEKKGWEIKKLKSKNLAISDEINLVKIENKIKNWWENKLADKVKEKGSVKILKRETERHLTNLLKTYFSHEYDIVIEEPLILFFQEH